MRIVATEYLSQPWAGTRPATRCANGVVLLRLPPPRLFAIKFASRLDALREFFELDRATRFLRCEQRSWLPSRVHGRRLSAV